MEQPSPMRFAEFLDRVPAAIYRSTVEGTILYCNLAFARLFGYGSSRELIGSAEAALYRNKRDRGGLVEALLRRGKLQDVLVTFRRRDGTDFQGAVSVCGVSDDDGIMVHLDGMLRNAAAGTSSPAVEEKLKGVLEMAGGVAHHMNQPLTIINNLLGEVLSEIPVEGPVFGKLVKIQQQVSRLIALTHKISSIKSYESMEYVAGVKIVDIEKASRQRS